MIHARELEVLNILAGSEVAMTSTNIIVAGNGLSQSTVMVVLRKLLKEGYVEVEGIAYCGNVLGRTFRITEAARVAVLDQFVENYLNIQNIVSREDVHERICRTSACSTETL
jgi:DNA-binding transcriptional ArsR family regulator